MATATRRSGLSDVFEQLFGWVGSNIRTDEEGVALLEQMTGVDGLFLLDTLGGLSGCRRDYPRTYSVIAQRVPAATLAWLTRVDARVLTLARNSQALQKELSDAIEGARALGRDVEVRRLTAAAAQRVFGYTQARLDYEARGEHWLLFWELDLGGDVAALARSLVDEASAAQREFNAANRLAAARRARAEVLVEDKTVVAEREQLTLDDDLVLEALLPPFDGAATAREAIVFARMSGQAAAVAKVESRWHPFRLNEQWNYDSDVWEPGKGGRTKIVAVGPLRPVISLAGGYPLHVDETRYFGGDLSEAPHGYFQDDLEVVERLADGLPDDEVVALFRQLSLDLVMVNLREAESRLNEALDRLYPGGLMDPDKVADLQARTAALRRHLLAAARAAAELGPEPTDQDLEQLGAALAAIGAIAEEDPTAPSMIVDERAPNSTEPPGDSDIVDRLEDLLPGNAITLVRDDFDKRLANIEATRHRLYADPDLVLAFRAVHGQLIYRFPDEARDAIHSALNWHEITQIAKDFGMTVAGLALMLAGAFAGPLGAVVAAGAGVGLGAYETAKALEQWQRLAAMTQLDVADGFALATPDEAASARNGVFLAVAFNLLDVGGFVRSAGQFGKMRALMGADDVRAALGGSSARSTRIAKALGRSERRLLEQLETLRGPARDELLRSIREVTGTTAGGGRLGTNMWNVSAGELVRMRVALMGRSDVGAVVSTVRAAGLNVDQAQVMAVKRYLFDSGGIGFMDYNVEWWSRLRAGRATVADISIMRHELAEIEALRKVQGFDFMGAGLDQMSASSRRQWLVRFDRENLTAHRAALRAEYDFLADQISFATGGRVKPTSNQVAAIDPRGVSPGRSDAHLYMMAEGRPLALHKQFYVWQALGRTEVEIGTGLLTRLRLRRPVLLGALIEAIKRAPPSALRP